MSAAAGFLVDMKMYKAPDYRCLKPVKGNPKKWPHYDMPGLRAAKTEEELKKVEEIPFDVNFFNLEDPKVFKDFTDPKKGLALWKKTYGFDYAAFIPGYQGAANMNSCQQDCLKAEYSKFAKDCKADGGFFKCCLLGYTIPILYFTISSILDI